MTRIVGAVVEGFRRWNVRSNADKPWYPWAYTLVNGAALYGLDRYVFHR